MTDALAKGALIAVLLASSAAALPVETITQTRLSDAGTPVPVTVEVVSGEALVRLAQNADPVVVGAALAALGGRLGRVLPNTGGWRMAVLPPGSAVAAGLAALRAIPGIVEAEPNRAYRLSLTPNDPLMGGQYGLTQIDASSGWDRETGATSRVTVAVVDAGVEATHAELSGKMGLTTDQFCDPGANKSSGADNVACANADGAAVACNHGTRVAGIAAASTNNGVDIAGVSWDAQIVSVKVFRNADCTATCGGAGCATDDQAIIDAVNFAIANQNGANYGKIVLNLSLGGAGACPAAVNTAFGNAVAAGIPVIVASGNDGGAVQSPGNCGNAIPVGATDASGAVTVFSSRGPELAANGVVAPGQSVRTTDTGGGTTDSATGTSFSAPHVAGVAALILSAKNTLTASQVKDALRQGANNIGLAGYVPGGAKVLSNEGGAGRVNAFLALQYAIKGFLADFQGQEKVVAFPNPFRANGSNKVFFAVPPSLQGDGAKLKIYDVAGRKVRDVNAISWDGKNDGGNPVASGTYLFVYSNARGTRTGRFSVIR